MGWPEGLGNGAFSTGETMLALPDPVLKVPLGPLLSTVLWEKFGNRLTCLDKDNLGEGTKDQWFFLDPLEDWGAAIQVSLPGAESPAHNGKTLKWVSSRLKADWLPSNFHRFYLLKFYQLLT